MGDFDADSGSAAQTPVVTGFVDLQLIGHGGFSSVYRGRDEILDRDVALKVINLGDRDRIRFQRECRILATLSEIVGVVPVMAAAETDDGRPVIVMKYMAGGSLGNRIRSNGPMNVADAVSMGLVLIAALGEAHRAGVVHRDIKPDNVLFSANGSPALADFGIAVVEQAMHSTGTMESLSPPYAPPERFLADTGTGEDRGDIYSLAATLYFAIKGSPPFGTAKQGGVAGLLDRITREPLPGLDVPDLPADLNQVLAKAMSKEPKDRYQSANEFAHALNQCASIDSTLLAQAPEVAKLPSEASLSEFHPEFEPASRLDVAHESEAPYWARDVSRGDPDTAGQSDGEPKAISIYNPLLDEFAFDEEIEPFEKGSSSNGKRISMLATGLIVLVVSAMAAVLVVTSPWSRSDEHAGKQSQSKSGLTAQSSSARSDDEATESTNSSTPRPRRCTMEATAGLSPGIFEQSIGEQTLTLGDDSEVSCDMSDQSNMLGKLTFAVVFPDLTSAGGIATGPCAFEWVNADSSQGQCTVTLENSTIHFALTVTKGSFVGKTASADIVGWRATFDPTSRLITGLSFSGVELKWT